MEKKTKKQSNKGSDPKTSSSRPKILGAGSLQFSDDDASRLIGGIVEKGISDDEPQNKLIAPPMPSVLPFPVARHRSHGPHWCPLGGRKYDIDSYGEEEEDKGFMEFDPIAPFANPVERKKKKGLDLSRWKDFVSGDNYSVPDKVAQKTEKERKSETAVKRNVSYGPSLAAADVFTSTNMDIESNLDSGGHLNKSGVGSTSDDGSFNSVTDMELDTPNELHVKENVKHASPVNLSAQRGEHDGIGFSEVQRRQEQSTMVSSWRHNFKNEQESMSLESQIDAENQARIQGMSPDEIAEAQAEIMEKINPTVFEALKRRGQAKLKKHRSSRSEGGTTVEQSAPQLENTSDVKGFVHSDHDISHVVTATSNNAQCREDNGAAAHSLWSAWNERVEAVRQLRFSLDGTVIKNDFVQVPGTGDIDVTERDFLRTEGDPGAVGYTIKEAVALTRSVVPGQRALALHLISSVLGNALHGIYKNRVGSTLDNKLDRYIDWEAVWAFALGPEPELVLSLRMSLDDNHNSVVLACAKVIQCILSCDVNENFFEISEKIAAYEKEISTAPVFRSKPEIDVGFLRGGFWKYSAKPSNILPVDEDTLDNESEGKHTIQDDIVVGGQDIAAGLVRMGILPRLHYLLETDPAPALEECIISVLVGIARHSPTCANAIMECHRLVETVVHRFTLKNNIEIQPSKIKSVSLLKVLARSDQKYCIKFMKNGTFQTMTWHLYQHVSSLDNWVKSGRENCKLSSALMVEQLRFWKVCVEYGYCVSCFSDIFPALCLWLNPPIVEKITQNGVLIDFTSISMEAYLVLEALARRLPNLFSKKQAVDDTEIWSWSCVSPMVDLAVKWITLKNDPHVSKLFEWQKGTENDSVFHDTYLTPLLWVYSAVMRMLCRVLEKVIPEDSVNLQGSGELVPWLPEFVPKVGLEIIRSGFFNISGVCNSENRAGSVPFIEELCHLRQQSNYETSLASVCCLHGFVQVLVNIDKLIQLAKNAVHNPSQENCISREGKILEDGILKASMVEMKGVLNIFMKLAATEWQLVQSIEIFGRGGPAPGLGAGWGASGGGFWSAAVLLAQIDAGFLIYLLENFQLLSSTGTPTVDAMISNIQRINSALGACLIAGPRDSIIVEKVLNILLHPHVLKFLDLCIRQYFHLNERIKRFAWEFKEDDYLVFHETLASHFRNRWLSLKKSKDAANKTSKKGSAALDTIFEDLDTSDKTNQKSSLIVKWAKQRLPLPTHWFLSPMSTICDSKHAIQQKDTTQYLAQDPNDLLEIAKAGLFFNLGVEAMSTFKSTDFPSPVQSVPLVWKLHSLSVILLVGMGILEEEKSRDVYEALQDIYGQLLDQARMSTNADLILEEKVDILPESGNKNNAEFLMFQSVIHESYSTFIETLVEQFAAISYGDVIFGRQLAFYLHRQVETPTRLAAWNILTNACVLDLLPPLEKCIAEAEGYLEPIEDNDGILEAYVKSWSSGALDRAATRGSVAYTLVIHHLSSFIFHSHAVDKLLLRNKLVKSLLRDYSRKQHHEGMMFNLIRYNKASTSKILDQNAGSPLERGCIEKRLKVLTEACEGNSSLLTEVEKLKSSV